jgi:MFS family permease
MTCDAYYKTHSDPARPLDHCSIPQIEADTARAVALLGASTTLFGVLNLFVTGWLIKKYGPKVALLISVFWPAVRLAIQNIGVMTGSYQGILIIQSSQIITILGGPAGYLLALNSYVIEVIEPSERTGALGKLQGCTFFGTSLAYLIGGLISDTFGILAPFRVTLGLFLTSCTYVILFLPWIPPQKDVPSQTSSGLKRFFGPLKALAPQRWVLQSGKIQTEYGPMLLASGTFLAVLATGFQSVLLQMYATDVWSFLPTENGYLISLNTFVRGLFLTMAFPRIISFGRKHLSSKRTLEQTENGVPGDSAIPDLPQQPNDFAGLAAMDEEEEPVEPTKLSNKTETFEFDLFYSRYSLLADGIITGAASFISQGWQLYLFAVLLPLAAGTGSAAKGSILQMCPSSERTDALSAITLVDMLARLSTSTSMFVRRS